MIKLNLNKNIWRFLILANIFIILLQSARYGDPHVHEIDRVHQQHEGVYTCVVGNGKLPFFSNFQLLLEKDLPFLRK